MKNYLQTVLMQASESGFTITFEPKKKESDEFQYVTIRKGILEGRLIACKRMIEICATNTFLASEIRSFIMTIEEEERRKRGRF